MFYVDEIRSESEFGTDVASVGAKELIPLDLLILRQQVAALKRKHPTRPLMCVVASL